jgi:osmotically-inducible protein OsmY
MTTQGKTWAFLGGVGLGALTMYFLDPRSGSGRRSLVRDRVTSVGRRTGEVIEGTARELADRTRAGVAQAKSRLEKGESADEVLSQRVRDALGRVISHPRLVSISARGGVVTLTGTVLEEDANALSVIVRGVYGVKDVVDQTEVREEGVMS